MFTTRTTSSIENPATGERIAFRHRSEDRLAFDYALAPGGFALGRLDHVHPKQVEQFAIESGRLGVRIDGDEWTATPGTEFAIPPGTAHTVWNEGAEPMHASVEIRPGLDLAAFFETTYGLAREGRSVRWGLPRPLQLAVLLAAFEDQLYLAGVPVALQRTAASALAPVGRRAGYRARYDRFAADEDQASTRRYAVPWR